jgi:hypothetical protein
MWVPYGSGQWRLKEFYDIRLKDGTEYKHMYPNGSSFSGKQGSFKDDDVAEIRLIPNSENPWGLRSGLLEQSYTVKRALDMFGEKAFPEVIEHPDGRIEFIPKRYRFFKDGEKNATDDGISCCFWVGEKTWGEMNGESDCSQPPS